jgi:predicted ATPase/DNA-binding XRE family transcriptional regulator
MPPATHSKRSIHPSPEVMNTWGARQIMVSLRWPTFAEMLRRQRRAAGLTQEQLAERAGLSPRAVAALERGVSRAPRAQTLRLLAEALGLSVAERAAFEAAARGQPPLVSTPGPRRSSSPHRPEASPLVGRALEITRIEQLLAGEGPPLLLVAGEPGIGKTRLVREAATRATERGWSVLAGGCARRGSEQPYAPLLDALAGWLRQRSAAQVRAELEGCAWLVRLLPELAESALVPAPTWSLPPEQERRLMFAAAGRFLANIAGPAGTLLLLDDLQWAGADALDLLASLIHTDLERPLRVLGTYRGTEVQPPHPLAALLADLARAGLVARTELGPLAPPEADHLLRLLLEAGASEEEAVADRALRERMLARAGGVPYFLVSCAQALRAGALDAADTPDADAVPWDVAQTIHQRVAALPPAAQELLAAAAAVGRVVPGALLVAVVDHPEDDVLMALEAACQARLLTELTEEGDDVYQFAHDLIREVVAAGLSSRRRKVLHRRVAQALERQPGELAIDQLAYHYTQAGVEDKAILYLERAGDRALALHANAEAEAHYRTLIERLETLGRGLEAAKVREKHGAALMMLARYDAALKTLERAAETQRTAGDQEDYGRIVAQIGRAHAQRGTSEAGLQRLEPLLASARAAFSPHAQAALYTAMGQLLFSAARYGEQLAATDRAIELLGATHDDRMLAEAERGQALALLNLGRTEEASQRLEHARLVSEAAGDLANVCGCLSALAHIYAIKADFAQSRRYAEHGLALAEQLGDPVEVASMVYLRGGIVYEVGEWDQAREDFERAITRIRQFDTSFRSPGPALALGALCLCEGRWGDASTYFAEAMALVGDTPSHEVLRVAQWSQAERDLVQGHPELACARLEPLLDRPGQQEIDVTTLLPLLAWAYLDLGDEERAEALVTATMARAAAADMQRTRTNGLRVQALLRTRQGRWDEAQTVLDAALVGYRAMPSPYGEAKALYVYGQLHAAQGEPERARERYAAALAILNRLGERLYAEHVERALAQVAHPASAPRRAPLPAHTRAKRWQA